MTPYKPPGLEQVSGWVDSEAISINSLNGKVVLVDFWTWGCVNCQRVIPHLVEWHQEFHNQGLEIIGIHSPEFDYEKDIEGVRDAISSYEIPYPIAQDNEMAVWREWGVSAWPTLFVIDKQGQVRFMHRGEGAYQEIGELIQQLLAE